MDPVFRQGWPLDPAALLYFHYRDVQTLLSQRRALAPLSQAPASVSGG